MAQIILIHTQLNRLSGLALLTLFILACTPKFPNNVTPEKTIDNPSLPELDINIIASQQDCPTEEPVKEICFDADGDPVSPEASIKLVFTATLSKPNDIDVSFRYLLVGKGDPQDRNGILSASENADYRYDDADTTLVFLANKGVTKKSFFVFINDDERYEVDQTRTFPKLETFAIRFGEIEGANPTEQVDNGIVISIQDNDLPPILSLNMSTNEIFVKESVGKITLKFKLDARMTSTKDIIIPYTLKGSTAILNEDFIDLGEMRLLAEGHEAEYDLLIIDDATANEPNETIVFNMDTQASYPDPPPFTLGEATLLIITLEDDEGNGNINPTGVTTCALDTEFSTDCELMEASLSHGQDGNTLNIPFSFKKINKEGGFWRDGDNQHACVRDDNTHLIWEVKRDPNNRGNPQNTIYKFQWFNPLPNVNGGNSGIEGGGQSCEQSLERCDTASYVDYINSIELCGLDNWRVPKINELLSITDFSGPGQVNTPLINTEFFPNTAKKSATVTYWTATPTAVFTDSAWRLNVRTGETNHANKEKTSSIRLVSNGNDPSNDQ